MIKLWPIIKQVLGVPADAKLRDAVAKLDGWYADGGHRRDLNRDGVDEHSDAIAILDAAWPKLLRAEFEPALGAAAFNALRGMAEFGRPTPGATPSAPAFSDGWYGYVSKDLRDLLTPQPRASRCRTVRRNGHRVRRCLRISPRGHRHGPKKKTIAGRYSRVYCGGGSLAACRALLELTLREALAVTPAQLYGQGDCAKNAQPSCFDQNRSTSVSGIGIKPFPFQNRPTFQQVAEPAQKLPR
jgi:hypothetical protein